MRKIICFALAIIQVLLLTACTGDFPLPDFLNPTEPEDTILYVYPSEIPVFEEDKELSIVAFWSPPNTEEWYQSMVDCGFTDVIIDGKYGVTPGSERMFNTLAICDKVGIDAYVAVGRGYVFSADPRYGEYESFKGINTDEPLTKANLHTIVENINILKTSFPDAKFWTGIAWGYPGDFISFEAMLDYYFEIGGTNHDSFSMAPYPLGIIDGVGSINWAWLMYLEQAAGYAKEYDSDLFSYLGSMSIRSQSSRRPEADDFRYTSYVPLAFGAKGLGHFCYTTPGYPPYAGEFSQDDYALINFTNADDFSTYYKTEIWYDAQEVNMELKGLDQAILSFDWQGIMKSIGSDAQTSAGKNCFLHVENWMRKHDGIKKFSSTEDAIMGVFKDENGYDGFMLVNFADTMYDRENTVNIQFRGASRAMIYIGGEPQMVDLVDGTYTVTLAPGEGQFIIPLN